MLPSQAGRSGKCQYVSFTDSAPYFTRTFLVGRSPGSEFVRGERDGGLDITGGPHEGTSRHDLYARYISHARLRTTTRDSDVQRQYFRGTIVTRSGLRTGAGLLHATGQTGNFSSRQTAHEIQAFCLISSTAAESERIASGDGLSIRLEPGARPSTAASFSGWCATCVAAISPNALASRTSRVRRVR